jgi:acetyl esterase/lipase
MIAVYTTVTTTSTDPNRAYWEAVGRDERVAWEELGCPPTGMEQEWIADPAVSWLRPHCSSAGRVILAIHGGGFVSGSVTTHAHMFGHLSRATGWPAFAVEYGLVPEHVFPSQLNTAVAAYRWLLAGGATRIAVVGDSCGATLAVGLAARTRVEQLPMPAALVLVSAWTDFEARGDSYATGSDPFFTRDVVRGLASDYLAGSDPHDPLTAPLFVEPRGLPPTYLQVGGEESLRDDSRALAERLRDGGVTVRLDEFPGQLHTFQMAAGRTTVADDAITRGARWLRSTLGG